MYVQKPLRCLYMHFTREPQGCKRSGQLHNPCCLAGKLQQMPIVKECKECPVTVTSICSAGPPNENLHIRQKCDVRDSFRGV